MKAIFLFIDQIIIELLIWIIIVSAVMSWLIAFNVINPNNPFVRAVLQALTAVTEPMLRPIRSRLPDFGGIDISSLILILGLVLLRYIIHHEILPRVG